MPDEYDAAVKDWNDALRHGHDALKAADTEWARAGDYRGGSPMLKPFTLDEFLALGAEGTLEPIFEGLAVRAKRGDVLLLARRRQDVVRARSGLHDLRRRDFPEMEGG